MIVARFSVLNLFMLALYIRSKYSASVFRYLAKDFLFISGGPYGLLAAVLKQKVYFRFKSRNVILRRLYVFLRSPNRFTQGSDTFYLIRY